MIYVRYWKHILAFALPALSLFLWKLVSAKYLSAEDFGALMVAYSATTLIAAAIYASLARYIVREAAKGRMGKETAVGAAIVSATVITLLGAILSAVTGNWYFLAFSAVSVPYAAWHALLLYERGRGGVDSYFKGYGILMLIILITIPAIRATHSPLVALSAYIAAHTLPVLVIHATPRFSGTLKTIRRALHIAPYALGNNALVNTDVVMLGILAGTAVAGGYKAMALLARPILILSSMATFVYFPRAARGGNLKKPTKLTLLPLFAFSLLYVSLFLVLPAPIVQILYGPRYNDLIPVLQVLIIFSAIHGILSVLKDGVIALEGEKIVSTWTIIGAGVNVALNALLIPALGALGAALATGASYVVSDIPPALFFLRRIAFNHNTQ